MGTNKKHRLLNNLDRIELEMIRQNTDYAKQYLTEEGFDVAKESEFAQQQIKKIKFRALAISNKQKDQHLLETAFNRIKEVIKENAQRSTDALLGMLQAKTPSVHYRNLDKWTDDEIREVLADVDLVKLMEELSREK